jgi:DNA primase
VQKVSVDFSFRKLYLVAGSTARRRRVGSDFILFSGAFVTQMSGRIPSEIIERIREATDIVELISSYVQLERKGGNYFGLCPFHAEKTPSFSVHPGKGIFHCFGCGVGGNAFTFLQLHDKLSFSEAARELAERCGIPIPAAAEAPRSEKEDESLRYLDALYRANELAAQFYTRCLLEGKGAEYDQARAYLKSREISPDLAREFRLGYAPDRWDGLIQYVRKQEKQAPRGEEVTLRNLLDAGLIMQKGDKPYDRFRGRLMFPILNLSATGRKAAGRVVGFGGRVLSIPTPGKGAAPAGDESPKYLNTPETPIYHKGRILYGLAQAREAIRRRGECLVVEGYMDLIRLHEAGFAHAVATSGTALTIEQAQLLRRFCRRIVLIFDGDVAGSKASLRGGDVLLAAGLEVRVVGLPAAHDPDSFIRSEGAAAFAQLVDAAEDSITYRIKLYRRDEDLRRKSIASGGETSPRTRGSILSRTETVRDIITSLTLIPDAVQRELTALQAAREIGLSENTMLEELQKALQRNRRPVQRSADRSAADGAKSADSAAKLPVRERELLAALLRQPELQTWVFSELNAEDFTPGPLRRIAEKLETAWMKGKPLQGEELIGEESPIEESSFIAQALSQFEAEAEPGVDRRAMRRYLDFKAAQDCLRGLLILREEKRYRNRAQDLKAENRLEITSELREIKAKIKDLQSRIFWALPQHPGLEYGGRKTPPPGDAPATPF